MAIWLLAVLIMQSFTDLIYVVYALNEIQMEVLRKQYFNGFLKKFMKKLRFR